jgi:soluble lytic murein transglycosylase-like protein
MPNGRRMGGAPWWMWMYAGLFAATLLLTLGLIYLTTVYVRTAAAQFAVDAATPHPVHDIPYADLINRTATAARLNPALLAAIVAAESAFDSHARSARGAYGLMQVMPGTWREIGGTSGCGTDALELGTAPACMERPEANLAVGAAYLRRLADRFNGDMVLTVAAYNAGAAPVLRYHGVPPFPETVRYVRQVSLAWLRLQSTGTLSPAWSAVIRRYDLWQRLRGVFVVALAIMTLPWAVPRRRLERGGIVFRGVCR